MSLLVLVLPIGLCSVQKASPISERVARQGLVRVCWIGRGGELLGSFSTALSWQRFFCSVGRLERSSTPINRLQYLVSQYNWPSCPYRRTRGGRAGNSQCPIRERGGKSQESAGLPKVLLQWRRMPGCWISMVLCKPDHTPLFSFFLSAALHLRGFPLPPPQPTTLAAPSRSAPTSLGASPVAALSTPGSSGRSGTSSTSLTA